MSAAPAREPGLLDGLGCTVGKAPIAVPTDRIQQIIEYRVTAPLPLRNRFIGGLAYHEGRMILSVELVPPPGSGRARTAQGILLHTPGSPVYWVLEVSTIADFVRARLVGGAPPPTSKLPPWINMAKTADDRSLGWIDVERMVGELLKPPIPLA